MVVNRYDARTRKVRETSCISATSQPHEMPLLRSSRGRAFTSSRENPSVLGVAPKHCRGPFSAPARTPLPQASPGPSQWVLCNVLLPPRPLRPISEDESNLGLGLTAAGTVSGHAPWASGPTPDYDVRTRITILPRRRCCWCAHVYIHSHVMAALCRTCAGSLGG